MPDAAYMKSPFDEEGSDKVPPTFGKHLFKYFNESWDAVAQKNDYLYYEKHEPLLATFALMERGTQNRTEST